MHRVRTDFIYKMWNRVGTYGFFEPGTGSTISRVGTGTGYGSGPLESGRNRFLCPSLTPGTKEVCDGYHVTTGLVGSPTQPSWASVV
ncbi:hypothetical protein Hanom_Chr11g01040681 [Helianthus anomalus]